MFGQVYMRPTVVIKRTDGVQPTIKRKEKDKNKGKRRSDYELLKDM